MPVPPDQKTVFITPAASQRGLGLTEFRAGAVCVPAGCHQQLSIDTFDGRKARVDRGGPFALETRGHLQLTPRVSEARPKRQELTKACRPARPSDSNRRGADFKQLF
jgi:hypothetical protein